MMVGNSDCFLGVLDYALLLGAEGTYDMDKFRGHDADGGQMLELSHHNVEMIVEMIVESPGHIVHDLRDF